MSSIHESMSIAELAAVASEALEAANLDAVLSGGSVVSIYSDNEYQSFDLDFVTVERMKALAVVMESLGFRRSTGRHFVNPNTPCYVEFPTGPLTVGGRPVKQTARLQTPLGAVRILTPTQCNGPTCRLLSLEGPTRARPSAHGCPATASRFGGRRALVRCRRKGRRVRGLSA